MYRCASATTGVGPQAQGTQVPTAAATGETGACEGSERWQLDKGPRLCTDTCFHPHRPDGRRLLGLFSVCDCCCSPSVDLRGRGQPRVQCEPPSIAAGWSRAQGAAQPHLSRATGFGNPQQKTTPKFAELRLTLNFYNDVQDWLRERMSVSSL